MDKFKEKFIDEVSLYLDCREIDKLIKNNNYIKDNYDFYNHFLNQVLVNKESKLKEKFVVEFYTSFCNNIIKNLINQKDLTLNKKLWAEEKVSGLLIEVMGKDEVMNLIFNNPNKISDLLENIDYNGYSLLAFFNNKISKLKMYYGINNMDSFIKSNLCMDLVEAISRCRSELNFNNKKLVK